MMDFQSFISFLDQGIIEHLKYPIHRQKKDDNNIEDIIDGHVYKAHFHSDGFLHGTPEENKQQEIHVSLQINTDGVRLFKSSRMEIWPVYYTINELHPKLRYVCHILLELFSTNQNCRKQFLELYCSKAALVSTFYEIFSHGITSFCNSDWLKIISHVIFSLNFSVEIRLNISY